jgi:hypothetical protein
LYVAECELVVDVSYVDAVRNRKKWAV